MVVMFFRENQIRSSTLNEELILTCLSYCSLYIACVVLRVFLSFVCIILSLSMRFSAMKFVNELSLLRLRILRIYHE